MGTGLCIDVTGANIKDGAEIAMWPPGGGANQKWDIDSNGFIRSRANAIFVIDVNGGAKPAKGMTKVTTWTAAVSSADSAVLTRLGQVAHQRWHYDGHYIIGFDGRVLDVDGAQSAQGTKVLLYDHKPDNSKNQQWDYKDGYFITRMGTGLCIDVTGGPANVKDGSEIAMWPPGGGANQKWDIDHMGFIRSRANAKFCIDANCGPKPGKGAAKISVWSAGI